MKPAKQKLSSSDVKYVAHLARLDVKEEELAKFQEQLSDILDFVSKLSELETNGVIPTSQVTGLENVFREDVIKPSLSQKDVLANASRKYNGFFMVKAVFEE